MSSGLLESLFTQSTNSEFLRTVYRTKCRELESLNQQMKEDVVSHKKELAVLYEERGTLKAEIESLKLKLKPKDEVSWCTVIIFVIIVIGMFGKKP